jgi:ERCC4-type nuclease
LDSIDNAHYAGRQRGGMKLLYGINFLAVEGLTKPHEPDGYLMEGFNGGASWGRCRYQHDLPYSKLFNYLVSVALTGVIITLSRDMYHTAYNVCCLYEYFRGPWDAHTSMREIQKLPLYGIGGRPSLVKRMAAQIDGIGVKLAEAAEAHFGTSDLAVERMMTATPAEWAKIKGISLQTAERIVKEIRGQG